jgi:hypothetical protein
MVFNKENPIIATKGFIKEVSARTSNLLSKDDQMRKGTQEAQALLSSSMDVTPKLEFLSDDNLCSECNGELSKSPIKVYHKEKDRDPILKKFCCIDCWNRYMNWRK